MDNIIEQINLFSTSNDNQFIINNIISSKDRYIIHTEVEKLGLFSKSKSDKNTIGKSIIIQKTSFEKSVEHIITIDYVKFLSTYAIIPLPILSPEYLNYYLDLFDPYYDCKKMHELLLNELKTQTLIQFKKYIQNIIDKILETIKNNDDYISFTKMNIDIPDILQSTKIYNINNINKRLISLDVRTANFRTLKRFTKTLFSSEWVDFLRMFTDSEFLLNSKYLREKIFGELNNKIQKLANIFIQDAINFINESEYIDELKTLYISNDEIIFEVSDTFDFNKFYEFIINKFGSTFHIKIFKLDQISNYSYFAKIFEDGKMEFKNIPKKFIPQCIKYYLNEEITEIDRSFCDESGLIAVYKKSIFD